MRVYFLAERLCALTINGAYLGLVDGFERSVELDPKDELFCELSPEGRLPLRFVLDERFLIAPPEGVCLYYTERGVAVYASGFLPSDQTLRVLQRAHLFGREYLLFRQGGLALTYRDGAGAHVLPLPDGLENATLGEHEEGVLLESDTHVALLSPAGSWLLCGEGRVLNREDGVTVETPFHDSLGHTLVYTIAGGQRTKLSVRAKREPTEATFALALFESVRAGADVSPYLAPALLPKKDALGEYLGPFTSVLLTGERDRVGLVYARSERVFDVRYFRIQIKEGRIENILPQS